MQVKACELKKRFFACFKNLKDEERFENQTRKLSTEFFHSFDQQPEGKAMFKS